MQHRKKTRVRIVSETPSRDTVSVISSRRTSAQSSGVGSEAASATLFSSYARNTHDVTPESRTVVVPLSVDVSCPALKVRSRSPLSSFQEIAPEAMLLKSGQTGSEPPIACT